MIEGIPWPNVLELKRRIRRRGGVGRGEVYHTNHTVGPGVDVHADDLGAALVDAGGGGGAGLEVVREVGFVACEAGADWAGLGVGLVHCAVVCVCVCVWFEDVELKSGVFLIYG